MARSFNGTSDYLIGSPGALVGVGAGAISLAAIVKLTSAASDGAIVYCGSGDVSGVDLEIFGGSYYLSSQEPALAAASVADGWHLVGASKAEGTVVPRFHKHLLSSGASTHADAGGSMPNGVAVAETDTLQIGRWGTASSRFNGHVKIVAVWDRALSDAEFDRLAFTLQAWYASGPKMGLLLDQATASTNISDWTGGGANITGGAAAVSTESTPVFSYGFTPLLRATSSGATPAAAAGTATAAAIATAAASKTAHATGIAGTAGQTTAAVRKTSLSQGAIPATALSTATAFKTASFAGAAGAFGASSAQISKTTQTAGHACGLATAAATAKKLVTVTGRCTAAATGARTAPSSPGFLTPSTSGPTMSADAPGATLTSSARGTTLRAYTTP